MGGVNKVVLIGNIGRDPEIKYTQSNIPVANFSLATSESWKDKNTGEWQEKTEWHRCVAWRHLAEKAEKKMRRGQQWYVEGRLETRKWQGNDGQDRYTTEIVASQMMLCGRDGEGKPAGVGESGHFNPPPTPDGASDWEKGIKHKALDDDDLPF